MMIMSAGERITDTVRQQRLTPQMENALQISTGRLVQPAVYNYSIYHQTCLFLTSNLTAINNGNGKGQKKWDKLKIPLDSAGLAL